MAEAHPSGNSVAASIASTILPVRIVLLVFAFIDVASHVSVNT